MFRTLASRLTLLSSLLFCGLALIMYLAIDNSIESYLLDDVDQELSSETVEFANLLRKGGIEAVRQQMMVEDVSEDVNDLFIRIFDHNHQVVFATDLKEWPVLPDDRPATAEESIQTFTASLYPAPIRIIWKPLPAGYDFQMGVRLDPIEKFMTHFNNVFAGVFIIALALGVGLSYLLTKRVLVGLQQIRAAADRISRGNLDAAIPHLQSGEEVNELACSVNHMQTRIKVLIDELQDVSNNIAHDLRSPVTRMRGLAETSLTGEQSREEYRSLAGAVIEECDGLVGMINTMLEIAETDAGIRPMDLQIMDVVEGLEDISELYSVVAEDRAISITSKFADRPLLVKGERSRLQRAFANLLDNALKFTARGGRVLIKASQQNDQAVIEIEDDGQGISDEDLPRVCERYFRSDHSRSTTGSGLGLSLVHSIVRAHAGELTIASQLHNGTCVTIRLPLAKHQLSSQ